MRLSIHLDPDLHRIAAARAQARGTSISREINTLVRAALSSPAEPRPAPPAAQRDPLTGFLVSPTRPNLTEDDFRRMDDDEDFRHAPASNPA